MNGESRSGGAESQQKQTQQGSPMLVDTLDDETAAAAPDAMSRRRFMQATAATAAVAVVGTGNVAAASEDVTPDYTSAFAHNQRIPGSVDVDLHEPGFSTLDHVADDGSVESLTTEHGYVLAPNRADDPETTPHNPVTLLAKNLVDVTYNDDGTIDKVQPHDEYRKFPRGVTYDDDSDTSTDEVDVSVLDATHWATDASGSTGSISVTDADQGGLRIEVTGQASGDTALATFDLSTVGSEDATITSGVARKFIQLVADIDVLNAASRAEVRAKSSTGTTAAAVIDPDGTVGSSGVVANSTGDSQVGEVRVGDVADLDDIQVIEIAVIDDQFDATFYGMNVEKESEWVFGTQEVQDSSDEDDDGDTTEVITQDVTTPTGSYSITGLDTLTGTAFENTGIRDVSYDVEVQVDDLPDSYVMARVTDTPDTYDRPKELEIVATFAPQDTSAYDLTLTLNTLDDTVGLPSSRYTAIETATGGSEFEDWSEVEDATWTDKTDLYSSVDSDVELLSTVSESDYTKVRQRVQLNEDDVSAATKSGSDGAAVGATSGGGAFSMLKTGVMGVLAFLGVIKRKWIFGMLRGLTG